MGRNALLIAAVVLVCCVEWSYAFGAGNIPSFSFIEGKAFRHGDIEDVLAELVKSSAGMFGMGKKFGGLDIKRIYFGNWLRDYSQAMDIAGLSKMPVRYLPVLGRPSSLAEVEPTETSDPQSHYGTRLYGAWLRYWRIRGY